MPSNNHKKSSRRAKILSQFSIFSRKKPLLDLLEIQRKSFFDLLKYGIPHELAKIGIFRETAKSSIFTRELELTLNPETYKFISPSCTPKQAILKGKTYACKLYVQATLVIQAGTQEKNLNTLGISPLPRTYRQFESPPVFPYASPLMLQNGKKMVVKQFSGIIKKVQQTNLPPYNHLACQVPERVLRLKNRTFSNNSTGGVLVPSLQHIQHNQLDKAVYIKSREKKFRYLSHELANQIKTVPSIVSPPSHLRGMEDLGAKKEYKQGDRVTKGLRKNKVLGTLHQTPSSQTEMRKMNHLPPHLHTKGSKPEASNTIPKVGAPPLHTTITTFGGTGGKVRVCYLWYASGVVGNFATNNRRSINFYDSLFACVETLASQKNVSEHKKFFSKNTQSALDTVINPPEISSLKIRNEEMMTAPLSVFPAFKRSEINQNILDELILLKTSQESLLPGLLQNSNKIFTKNYALKPFCVNSWLPTWFLKNGSFKDKLKIRSTFLSKNLFLSINPFHSTLVIFQNNKTKNKINQGKVFGIKNSCFLFPTITLLRQTDKHLILNSPLTKENKIQSNFGNFLFPYWRTGFTLSGEKSFFSPVANISSLSHLVKLQKKSNCLTPHMHTIEDGTQDGKKMGRKEQLFGFKEQKTVDGVEELKRKNNDIQVFRPWIFLGELPLMTKRGHFILNGSPRVIVNQMARCPGIYFQEKRRGVGFEQEIRVSADLIPQRGPWLRIQSDWEGRFWARLKQEGRVKYATLYEAFQEFEKEYNAPLVSLLATSSSPFLKSEIIAFQERKTKEDRQKNALIRLFKNSTRYSLGKIGRFRINQRVHFSSLYESIRQQHYLNLSSVHPLVITSLRNLVLSSLPKDQYEMDQYTEVTSASKYSTPTILFAPKSIYTVNKEDESNKELENSNFCILPPQHYLVYPLTTKDGGASHTTHLLRKPEGSKPHTTFSGLLPSGLRSKWVMQKMGSNHLVSDHFCWYPEKGSKGVDTFGMPRYVGANDGQEVMVGQRVLGIPSLPLVRNKMVRSKEKDLLPSVCWVTALPPSKFQKKYVDITESTGASHVHTPLVSQTQRGGTPKVVPTFGTRSKEMVRSTCSNAVLPVLPSSCIPTFGVAKQRSKKMVAPVCNKGVATYLRYAKQKDGRHKVMQSSMVCDNDAIIKGKKTENSLPKGTNYLLMAKDIDAIHICLERLLEGQGFTDDIDHLKNRFIRTSGKLLQQQFELGLHRLNEVIKPLLGNLLQGHLAFLKESSDLTSSNNGPLTGSQIKAGMSCIPTFGVATIPKVGMQRSKKMVCTSSTRTHSIKYENGINTNRSNVGIVAPFRWLRTSKPVNGAFREFFGSNPLSQYMDQTNPLAEITHKRRLSSMGPGGIKRETAGMEVRGIHPTHYGRVCPIETPEGKNAGLVNSPTVYGRVGKYGFLETPLYQVLESQVQTKRWTFFSAQQEEEEKSSLATCDTGLLPFNFLFYTPIPVQTANNPLAHFQQVERSRVGYRALSPVQTISIATALIPFLEHDDANRALMGSNMQRQAIPLLLPERPIVGTGFEPLALVESGQALQATKLGCISQVNANTIIIHSIHSTRKALLQSVLRNTIDNAFINQIENKRSVNSHFDFRHVNPSASPSPLPKATHASPTFGMVAPPSLPSFCIPTFGVATIPHVPEGEKHQRWYVGMQRSKKMVAPVRSKMVRSICSPSKYSKYVTPFSPLKEIKEMRMWYTEEDKKVFINKLMKNTNGINGFASSISSIYTKNTKMDQSKEILSITKTIPHKTTTRLHLCSSYKLFLLKPFKQTLQLYQRSNQETCLNQRPLVQEGHWVQKGDFLADCSASDSGDLALGKNVTVAYMPWEGYNFEDAIVISDRLISDDVYTSLHIERYELKVNKNSQGKERITNQIPGTSRFLKHLDSFGIARVSSWVQPGDILVGKVVELKRPLSPYERLAWELASRLSPASPEREKWLNKVWLEDISLRLPPGVCGRVVNSQIVSTEWSEKEQVAYPLEVHVYLAVKRKIQIGDKLAGRHGNKGIVSTILPQQDMPYLGDGTSVDMILNPLGVPSRMNLGQIFECLLGLAGSQLGCNFKITPFDEIAGGEASRSLVFLKLYQCRLMYKQQWLFTPTFPGKNKLFDGRTGEPFENWVTVGQAYMLKLIHMVDHKIHARSTGPYSLFTRQPVRGRSRRGGQRLGEMEVWAVEGFGAAYTLQEFLTIKSDDLKARTALQRGFYKQNDVTFGKIHISPGNPEAFKVLVSELQALCLHIQM